MNLPRWCLAALVAASLAACTAAPSRVAAPEAAAATPAHDNLNAVIWMQTAAEYEAAVRGVYASARRSLDQALDDPSWNALPQGEFAAGFEVKPAAIIVEARRKGRSMVSSSGRANAMRGGVRRPRKASTVVLRERLAGRLADPSRRSTSPGRSGSRQGYGISACARSWRSTGG